MRSGVLWPPAVSPTMSSALYALVNLSEMPLCVRTLSRLAVYCGLLQLLLTSLECTDLLLTTTVGSCYIFGRASGGTRPSPLTGQAWRTGVDS